MAAVAQRPWCDQGRRLRGHAFPLQPRATQRRRQRQASSLLPGDRHQPRGAGHPPGEETHSNHYGHRDRQNFRRHADRVEAVEDRS